MKFTLQEPEDTELIQLLTKATDNNTPTADWALFITICHKINQTKHSGKAVRKFLQKNLNTKKSHTQILTLALLKVITENCPQFDEQLGNNSLIKELQLVWNDPGTYAKTRDLLIQCVSVWILEFGRTQPNHPILRFCYQVNQTNLIQTQHIYASPLPPPPPPHLNNNNHQQHVQYISQEQVNRTQNNNNNNYNNEMHMNRKSSLFRGWKLKRSSSNTTSINNNNMTPPTPLPITVNQQQSTITTTTTATFPNSPQFPPVPPKENKGEKILSSIEESKTTSKLLNQLISESQLHHDDDSLVKELYQKCQDLHAIIMRYIEETEDPVYLSILIDTNNLLIKAIDTYKMNKQENNDNNNNNGEIPRIILTEKALGKRPIRHNNNDLLVYNK